MRRLLKFWDLWLECVGAWQVKSQTCTSNSFDVAVSTHALVLSLSLPCSQLACSFPYKNPRNSLAWLQWRTALLLHDLLFPLSTAQCVASKEFMLPEEQHLERVNLTSLCHSHLRIAVSQLPDCRRQPEKFLWLVSVVCETIIQTSQTWLRVCHCCCPHCTEQLVDNLQY